MTDCHKNKPTSAEGHNILNNAVGLQVFPKLTNGPQKLLIHEIKISNNGLQLGMSTSFLCQPPKKQQHIGSIFLECMRTKLLAFPSFFQ